MKNTTAKKIINNIFSALISSASLVDLSSRSLFSWGEPQFPNKDDFK